MANAFNTWQQPGVLVYNSPGVATHVINPNGAFDMSLLGTPLKKAIPLYNAAAITTDAIKRPIWMWKMKQTPPVNYDPEKQEDIFPTEVTPYNAWVSWVQLIHLQRRKCDLRLFITDQSVTIWTYMYQRPPNFVANACMIRRDSLADPFIWDTPVTDAKAFLVQLFRDLCYQEYRQSTVNIHADRIEDIFDPQTNGIQGTK